MKLCNLLGNYGKKRGESNMAGKPPMKMELGTGLNGQIIEVNEDRPTKRKWLVNHGYFTHGSAGSSTGDVLTGVIKHFLKWDDPPSSSLAEQFVP